jgi:predicted nuclease with TOPRIM domain
VDLKAEGLKKRLAFNDEVINHAKEETTINTAINKTIKEVPPVTQTATNSSDEPLAEQINKQLEKVRQERALLEERIKTLNDRESDLLLQLERAEMLRDLM